MRMGKGELYRIMARDHFTSWPKLNLAWDHWRSIRAVFLPP